MRNRVFELIQKGKMNEELSVVEHSNQISKRFGLTLSHEDAIRLIETRNVSLRKHQRVEFGPSILNDIIFAFCDSSYITQDHYLETLIRLQDIFYEYKNELEDSVSDEELLHFMREKFETVCGGDLDYLEGTCLEAYVRQTREKGKPL